MTDLPVPLSASKLKLYQRCPEAFKIRYVDRRPEGPPNKYLRRGNAVHDAIEATLPGLNRLDDAALIEQLLKSWYREHGDAYRLDDEMEADVLTSYANAAKFVADRDPEIRGIELPVYPPADFVDHPHGFRGYIDVATDSEVWDWKTGKSEGKSLDENLQGAVYMAGYYSVFDEPPAAIRFVYLREGTVHTHEPGDDLWAVLVEKAEAVMTALDNDHFPAKPGPSKCHFCDYERHCTTSPVGVGNVEWEAYP